MLEGLRREGVNGFADFIRPKDNPELLFSVIIPTHNRAATLRECLEGLARQRFDLSRVEVLVCDDGSTDDTATKVAAYAAPYPLHYLRQENRGPAAARNRAIKQARGHYLLILNDDAILEPDALALHLAAHQDHPGDKIAVLGRFTFPPALTNTPFGHALEHSTLLFNYAKMKAGEKYDFNCFYTCNLSLPRQAVVDIGMFDEAFTGPAAEDIELGYRLLPAGLFGRLRAEMRGLASSRHDAGWVLPDPSNSRRSCHHSYAAPAGRPMVPRIPDSPNSAQG